MDCRVGCGRLTAAKIIGKIAGIDRFQTDAQLARSCGAPIPACPGKRDRHHLDRGGNRQLNSALHRLVNEGRLDPETKAYLPVTKPKA